MHKHKNDTVYFLRIYNLFIVRTNLTQNILKRSVFSKFFWLFTKLMPVKTAFYLNFVDCIFIYVIYIIFKISSFDFLSSLFKFCSKYFFSFSRHQFFIRLHFALFLTYPTVNFPVFYFKTPTSFVHYFQSLKQLKLKSRSI